MISSGEAFKLRTPQTHPDHHTIGHLFVATDFTNGDELIYFCDSHDPRCGYWMTLCNGIGRKNVSERAIDRTFHTIYFDIHDGKTRVWSRWGNPFATRSRNQPAIPEFQCRWTCPNCGAVNNDLIHPIDGPFLTCTCHNCQDSFTEHSRMDSESAESLESARRAAEQWNAERKAKS